MTEPEPMMDHWPLMARQWEQVGPPLRPSAEDVALYQHAAGRWRGTRPPRVLIMGVTPELYRLGWPDGTDILAVDNAKEMIEHVWPGPRSAAVCADWTDMPLPPASRDIAVCDGGLSVLAYPDRLRALLDQLRRVLAPGGLFIVRMFVPPAARETPDAVLRDLFAGLIPDLNALKLRLWTAMSGPVEEGVSVQHVWRAVHHAEPDFERLAGRLGWPLEHLLAIDAYRDSPARYYFPTVEDVRRVFGGELGIESVSTPAYPLGDRCPIVALRRLSSAPTAPRR